MKPGAWDVLVVGAGPAGSTVAALLAQAGASVLVLEKDEFPRFHIGESLLPGMVDVLARIGVRPEGATFLHKSGAQFVCEATGRSATFSFADALDGCPPNAWHVERSVFDTQLRDAARAAGAEVRHGVTVRAIEPHEGRVDVRTADGDLLSARFLVDATGQDRLLATLHESATPHEEFGHAAVFTHFTGLPQAALDDLGEDNDIRVLLRDDGWGWLIPLTRRRLSVGLVCRGRPSQELLEGLLQGPLVRRWTAGAERGPTRFVRNYSVRNDVPRGRRWAAIGDAACFIDPVFSSGVMLAMRGAEDLADRLAPALLRGEEAATDFASPAVERAVATFHALVDRFYNTTFARTLLLGDSAGYETRRGVLSVLAGDVFRDDNAFQAKLLAGRRRAHARS